MALKDIARRLSDDIWEVFAPLLPPGVWGGNGRPPQSHKDCWHGLLCVLVAGLAWARLAPCGPAYKTSQRRLTRWLPRAGFRTAWGQRAQQYEQLQGSNGEQSRLAGSKQPSQKGVQSQALRQLSAPSVGPPGTERATHAPGPG